MGLPSDYAERVYAGVLGKVIGVYLGRPFEGWTYDRIMAELGEVDYYVHDKLGAPLVVMDDDISGTFTFLRALPDYGNDPRLTPAQIGQTWLNYIVEERSILWWGGMGNSTENTAYLRLKSGIPAPRSGSAALNGRLVAEQVGAQIFIDGWAMVCPGDPERAADFARRAATVSHDGEAVHGAQVIAAMEALAFVEPDMARLHDVATSLIPRDSLIYRLIADLREWRAKFPDWRAARRKVEDEYGYDRYGWNCHIVPNHALIHLALLYGDDDFRKTLMIVNTSGWDTDCNSANAGCLMGIKNGLAGIDAGPDWRGPVADRLYLPTADGGRCVSDALREAYEIINVGRSLAGEPPLKPKEGARFHFSLPGSMQGFSVDERVSKGIVTLRNAALPDRAERGLEIAFERLAPGSPARVSTPTFVPPADWQQTGYALIACPTLYPGQRIKCRIVACADNDAAVSARMFLTVYGAADALETVYGPGLQLAPRAVWAPEWRVPDTDGCSIQAVGLELNAVEPARGAVYLDYLTWDGVPSVFLTRPAHGGGKWLDAWVRDMSYAYGHYSEPLRLIQNSGRGLLIQGCREWRDYRVSAEITPVLLGAAGIAARVQGLRRYYAFTVTADGKARLIKALDGDRVLAEAPCDARAGQSYRLALQVEDRNLSAYIDGALILQVADEHAPLLEGAVAFVCEEGCFSTSGLGITRG